MLVRLQATMSDDVGPLRTEDGLTRALATIDELDAELGERPFGDGGAFDMQRLDWFDLRNMLHGRARGHAGRARCAPKAAAPISARTSPGMMPQWRVNQVIRLRGEQPRHRAGARLAASRAAQ